MASFKNINYICGINYISRLQHTQPVFYNNFLN